jgi:hypothetical protein
MDRRCSRSRRAVGIAALAIVPLCADAVDLSGLPAPLAGKVTAAQQECAEIDNGRFKLDWGAVTRVDLDGDLAADWVLDDSGYACSTAAAFYCSTAGCLSHFLVGETLTSIRNQGWTMITFGRTPVLLTRVHGSDCGGNAPTPCFTAYVWDANALTWQWRRPGADQPAP